MVREPPVPWLKVALNAAATASAVISDLLSAFIVIELAETFLLVTFELSI